MRALRFARLWRITAWLLLAVVVILSLIPGPPSPPLLTWDKSQHALAWSFLAWWFLQAWDGRQPLDRCLLLLGVSAIVELLQGMTPYRTADWHDVLANAVGVASGFMLWCTPLGGALHWLEGWVVERHYR